MTTRREFLKTAVLGTGAAVWLPALRITPNDPTNEITPPPAFPTGIPLYRQGFENWAKEIVVDAVWTCTPANANDAVRVANWAAAHGYTVRARGSMHGWSPLAIPNGGGANVVMLDTSALNGIAISRRGSAPTVTVGAGALLEDVMATMERSGYGFTATPAPGDITMGGALAIDAHGAAIPAAGERAVAGQSFGSLSNLVTSLTIVAWDEPSKAFALRTIDRSHPLAKSVLAHLARSLVVEATLQVSPNARLRCVSRVDIPATKLFAAPGTPGETFTSFLNAAGRVEAIWYAFTEKPWLKVWSVAPVKPPSSREVTEPYNYVFSDNIPIELSDLANQIIKGNGAATPLFGQLSYAASAAGLAATASLDLWGWSRNLLLYIKPTTIRTTANGYAVLTRRSDVQRVLHEFSLKYRALLTSYRDRGQYPANMPVEIRVTGLDQPRDSIVAGAETPSLSALSPDATHPERDVAVWFDVLTFPGTPGSPAFMSELEDWFFDNYASYATVRVEWSKGWAYSAQGAWTDPDVIGRKIPASLSAGRSGNATFAGAARQLKALDPRGVFTSPLLDELMPNISVP